MPRIGLALAMVLAIALATPAGSPAAEAGLALPGPSSVQPAVMKTLGTHWVRMFVTWPDIEPARGAFDEGWLKSYEKSFRELPAGTKVVLDVVDSPQWETGSSDEHTPPADPADYSALLSMLAQRFGSHVSAYELWNEEDASGWWSGGPNPSAYVSLLKATYPAIKTVEPNATVLLGGLTGNDYQYLEGVYQAGGKGYFDAVGVHTDTACNTSSPYSFLRGADNRLITDSFLAYREVRAVMLANGDDKPIWMTELSWRTPVVTCSEGFWAGQGPGAVSEETQASYLAQAYHCLAEDPYVKVALWYPLVDAGAVTSGLIREDGTRKPSFAAMKAYAHQGDTLSGPCGNFTGPKINVASPSNHIRYSGPLSINVSASSSDGVFRIRLEVDGKLIRNYDGGSPYPSYLAGAITWQGAKHISFGQHTLTFLAYDKERNVSSTTLSIYHVEPKPKRHHARKHARRHHRKHG